MKNIFKAAALLAAVLMLFCVTGCGDNAGGTPAEPPFVANETPLTLEAIQAGTITLTNPWPTLKYKKNGSELVGVTASANTIAVAAGDKIAFYAGGSDNTYDSSTDTVTALRIRCSSDFYVYGNVMSLLSSSDFKNATSISTEYALAHLFDGNNHIKNHSQKALVLPATTLAASCYSSMFSGCTSLTSAPALPATTLEDSDYCYFGMFSGCTSLTSAPALPATTLSLFCYSSMFAGCTSLTSTPVLPAMTLAAYCYMGMFINCSSLNSVTCLATEISETGCTAGWLYNVASSGTFTKASSMSTRDINTSGEGWILNSSDYGIPTNWTVQNYSAPQQ